jgi:hypothetical protein
MRIFKTLQKADSLATKLAEEEKQAQARREELMIRLEKSRNNNLKLFSLNAKGENF